MICKPCKVQDHESCKKDNRARQYSSCDCQHRTEQKTVILPQPLNLTLLGRES